MTPQGLGTINKIATRGCPTEVAFPALGHHPANRQQIEHGRWRMKTPTEAHRERVIPNRQEGDAVTRSKHRKLAVIGCLDMDTTVCRIRVEMGTITNQGARSARVQQARIRANRQTSQHLVRGTAIVITVKACNGGTREIILPSGPRAFVVGRDSRSRCDCHCCRSNGRRLLHSRTTRARGRYTCRRGSGSRRARVTGLRAPEGFPVCRLLTCHTTTRLEAMGTIMIASTTHGTIIQRGVAVNTRGVVLGATKASSRVNIRLP